MTEYTIWVGGERSWHRSYLGEIGAEKLSDDVVKKYFTFDEDGDIQFDKELLSEKIDAWGDEETDLPTWNTITDGCLGWGAYTDQLVGVCKTEEDDRPLFLKCVDELPWYTEREIKDGDHHLYDDTQAIVQFLEELNFPSDVWILYNSYEKGGYGGTFELDDEEEFDPTKLVLHVTQINESFEIVTGAHYGDIDIEMSGDSDGKGIDWYVCYRDQRVCFR